jgi:hypothetical protein
LSNALKNNFFFNFSMSSWTKNEINRWLSDMGGQVNKSLALSKDARHGAQSNSFERAAPGTSNGTRHEKLTDLEEALHALRYLVKYLGKQAHEASENNLAPSQNPASFQNKPTPQHQYQVSAALA